MMHPQDEQSLQRLLGLEELPASVLAEYALRQGMYHRDGNSGPLGTLALIDLVRFLNLSPPAVKQEHGEVDWTTVPQDGTVRVEANFFGGWQPGTFLGFVEHGILAVRLDADAMVRECRRHVVRLAADQTPPNRKPDDDDGPDARAELLNQPAPETVVDIGPVEYAEGNEFERPAWQPDVAFDWNTAKTGDGVWVRFEGDIIDAEFYGLKEDGTIDILIEGETTPRNVPADSVTPTGQGVAA